MSGVFYHAGRDQYLYGVFQNNQTLLEKGNGFPYKLMRINKLNQYQQQRIYKNHSVVVLFLPPADQELLSVLDTSKYIITEETDQNSEAEN